MTKTIVISSSFPLISLFIASIPLISAFITISYLGTTFTEKDLVLNTEDWRRKWLIFFAWVYIIVFAVSLLYAISLSKKV